MQSSIDRAYFLEMKHRASWEGKGRESDELYIHIKA